MSIAIFVLFLIPKEKTQQTSFGVWWWNNRLDNSYLDFASDNDINEIYYYTSSFDDKTNNFIKLANSKNIKVFLLTGEYQWIENFTDLENTINKYIEYQNNYPNKFAGIHFDIEPHQFPDFEENKSTRLTQFVEMTVKVKKLYPNIWIEYDIPVWMHDKVTYQNITKKTYEFIIDNSNKVTLMSYRDSCEEIYKSAKDEIEYAVENNKILNLSVETSQNNESFITFYEEGKTYMYNELNKLKKIIPSNFGIAIHHIYTWYNLKQ